MGGLLGEWGGGGKGYVGPPSKIMGGGAGPCLPLQPPPPTHTHTLLTPMHGMILKVSLVKNKKLYYCTGLVVVGQLYLVIFKVRGFLLTTIVGQETTVLTVGAGWIVWTYVLPPIISHINLTKL